MRRLLFLLSLIALSSFAETSRYVDAPELQTKDRAAINQNFQGIDNSLAKITKKIDRRFSNLGYIIAKDNGIVCDSSHDDTTAINNLFAVALEIASSPPFTQVNPTVIFPSGVCVVSSSINISGINILGQDQYGTIFAATHNGPVFYVDTTPKAIYYQTISNFSVEGRNGGNSVIGLKLTGTKAFNNGNISSVHFRGCYTGILNEITWEDYGSNSINANSFDNYGSYNTYYAIRYTGGHTVSDLISNNIAAVSGYFFHQVDYAAGSIGVGDILITGNYTQLGISAVYIRGDSSKYRANFRVIGNSFMDTSSYPIDLQYVTNSTFIGNTQNDIAGTETVLQGVGCLQNLVDYKGGGIQSGGTFRVDSTYSGSGVDLVVPVNNGIKMTDGTVSGISYLSGTLTNSMAIGTTSNHPLIFGTNNTFPAVTIDGSQRVGIGESTLSEKLTVGSNSDTTNINTRINGKTSTGSSAGTFTNAPAAGNPVGYLSVNINGTERKIPYW